MALVLLQSKTGLITLALSLSRFFSCLVLHITQQKVWKHMEWVILKKWLKPKTNPSYQCIVEYARVILYRMYHGSGLGETIIFELFFTTFEASIIFLWQLGWYKNWHKPPNQTNVTEFSLSKSVKRSVGGIS